MAKFLTEKENLLDLVSGMAPEEASEWRDFRHLEIVSGFIDRIYVVYTSNGTDPAGHSLAPNIHTTVRIAGLEVDAFNGVEVLLYDDRTFQTQRVQHQPVKLMEEYSIYVSAPTRFELRIDARRENSMVDRVITFPLLVKTKTKSTFMNKGNQYMLTLNRFKELYPGVRVKI